MMVVMGEVFDTALIEHEFADAEPDKWFVRMPARWKEEIARVRNCREDALGQRSIRDA